jgi:DNA-binding IclR family transcriptional regulator
MTSVSQSVGRCLAVFELFAERQSELTAAEIAEHLGAPRSSVAALLKELVGRRMLSLNRRTLTYLPTLGFAQLGGWLTDPAHFPTRIAEMVETLQIECGETVTASWPLDSEMEVIRVERSRQPISFIAEVGQRLPLWRSAVGEAYLATLSNAQIDTRWQKDHRRIEGLPALEEVGKRIARTRRDGVAIVHSGVFEGASAIARAADVEYDGRPVVISVTGPENRVRAHEDRYREMVLRIVNR